MITVPEIEAILERHGVLRHARNLIANEILDFMDFGPEDDEDEEPEHTDHSDRRLCQGIGCPYGDH